MREHRDEHQPSVVEAPLGVERVLMVNQAWANSIASS
jgi:hypothetical protein